MIDVKKIEERNLDCECKRAAKTKEQAFRSAFCHAAAAGDTVMLEYLENAGALADVTNCVDALERAAEKGHKEALQFLLPKYDGSLSAWQIEKVLHAAVQSKDLASVQLILDWVDGKMRSPQPPQGPGA